MVFNDTIKTVINSKNFVKTLQNASDEMYGTAITLTNNEIKDIIFS